MLVPLSLSLFTQLKPLAHLSRGTDLVLDALQYHYIFFNQHTHWLTSISPVCCMKFTIVTSTCKEVVGVSASQRYHDQKIQVNVGSYYNVSSLYIGVLSLIYLYFPYNYPPTQFPKSTSSTYTVFSDFSLKLLQQHSKLLFECTISSMHLSYCCHGELHDTCSAPVIFLFKILAVILHYLARKLFYLASKAIYNQIHFPLFFLLLSI